MKTQSKIIEISKMEGDFMNSAVTSAAFKLGEEHFGAVSTKVAIVGGMSFERVRLLVLLTLAN